VLTRTLAPTKWFSVSDRTVQQRMTSTSSDDGRLFQQDGPETVGWTTVNNTAVVLQVNGFAESLIF